MQLGNKLPSARTARSLSNEKANWVNINTVVVAKENLELKSSKGRLDKLCHEVIL